MRRKQDCLVLLLGGDIYSFVLRPAGKRRARYPVLSSSRMSRGLQSSLPTGIRHEPELMRLSSLSRRKAPSAGSARSCGLFPRDGRR
jgi:hypothetical protein